MVNCYGDVTGIQGVKGELPQGADAVFGGVKIESMYISFLNLTTKKLILKHLMPENILYFRIFSVFETFTGAGTPYPHPHWSMKAYINM